MRDRLARFLSLCGAAPLRPGTGKATMVDEEGERGGLTHVVANAARHHLARPLVPLLRASMMVLELG